jgi:peptidoglycan-associated lipoprotein
MRRGLLLTCTMAAIFLAGCPSKPKDGECKTSADCAEQQGFGKVCVSGRCQECGADTDCQAGFACRENKCVPKPECAQDADCGAGRTCQAGKCAAAKAECDSDAQCGSGRACQTGRCVTRQLGALEQAAQCTGGEDNFVHFAFDRADLDSASRTTLDKLAGCLKPLGVSLIVEGHCDQRGTTEYNLHLGERRAEAVKKYLVNLGLDSKKVRATSYGKERPLCTQDDESCWARNRRGVVKAEGADRS